MPTAMKQAGSTVATVLQIAGSASGVPYLGAAGEILGHIIAACDSVTVNKVRTCVFSIVNATSELISRARDDGLLP